MNTTADHIIESLKFCCNPSIDNLALINPTSPHIFSEISQILFYIRTPLPYRGDFLDHKMQVVESLGGRSVQQFCYSFEAKDKMIEALRIVFEHFHVSKDPEEYVNRLWNRNEGVLNYLIAYVLQTSIPVG